MWLSLLALFVVDGSDMVSVVVRSSGLQLATPPVDGQTGRGFKLIHYQLQAGLWTAGWATIVGLG
jgi:hypothetical protein